VCSSDLYRDAGRPGGVFNLVMGPGESVGQEIQENPGIDGVVFTGSYEVGMALFRTFSKRWPKPCIVEMGGKNPAIVTAKADLDEAADGIVRSAFGFGGQKCSANSRVYVERRVHDELVRLLVQKTEKITIGDPLARENWLGPIIDERAVERYLAAVADARRDGRVLIGGERLSDGDLARGTFVTPAVVGHLPSDHRLFKDELFVPFTAVHAVDSLDEARRLANDSTYGLTAGVYSEDPADVERFLDDYNVHRTHDYGLLPPALLPVARCTFQEWMKRKGKLGGQHKVPRVPRDPRMFDELLEISGGPGASY
jgi:1-pyrroline-5-carboxylate dehydrogenase